MICEIIISALVLIIGLLLYATSNLYKKVAMYEDHYIKTVKLLTSTINTYLQQMKDHPVLTEDIRLAKAMKEVQDALDVITRIGEVEE